MAQALLGEGAEVVIASRSEEKVALAVNKLANMPGKASGLLLDVRSDASVAQAVEWVAAHWGRLDVLINNAGIGMKTVNPQFITRPQPFFEVEPDKFRDLIDDQCDGLFSRLARLCPDDGETGAGEDHQYFDELRDHETQGVYPVRAVQSRGRITLDHYGGRLEAVWYCGEPSAPRRRDGDGDDSGCPGDPGRNQRAHDTARSLCDGGTDHLSLLRSGAGHHRGTHCRRRICRLVARQEQ